MHCRHDITRSIYDMSSTVYDITITVCVTSHNDSINDITHYVYHTCALYGITHSVMTTQPLWNFAATMSDTTPTVSVSSLAIYQFDHTQCMYDITATIGVTLYALNMTSHPLFMTSHHFIDDIKPTISDITSLYLTSRSLYLFHHSHSVNDFTATLCMISHMDMCDLISTQFMTACPLCMTSQHCVLMTPHSPYV